MSSFDLFCAGLMIALYVPVWVIEAVTNGLNTRWWQAAFYVFGASGAAVLAGSLFTAALA